MDEKLYQRVKTSKSEIFWRQNPVLLKTIVLPESKSKISSMLENYCQWVQLT